MFELLVLILFCWFFIGSLRLAFRVTWGLAKITAVLLLALALPLETLVIPLITNDLFGIHSYEKILGIFMAMNYAGYALGSPIANLSFDLFGSYKPMIVLLGILIFAILLFFQVIINAAKADKNKLTENAL